MITFVSDGIEGAWANDTTPLVASGSWLQVYLNKQHRKKLLEDVDHLLMAKKPSMVQQFPVTLECPELHLTVTVVA